MAGPNLSPSDFARVLEVACKEEFFRIYEDSYYQDAAWKDAVMTTSSDGETEYYGFGGRLPVPGRIDEDARIHYGLDDESYSLTNYTYGLAIDIHRKIVEDDRHNYIRQKFQSAAIGHQIKLQDNWATLLTAAPPPRATTASTSSTTTTPAPPPSPTTTRTRPWGPPTWRRHSQTPSTSSRSCAPSRTRRATRSTSGRPTS